MYNKDIVIDKINNLILAFDQVKAETESFKTMLKHETNIDAKTLARHFNNLASDIHNLRFKLNQIRQLAEK